MEISQFVPKFWPKEIPVQERSSPVKLNSVPLPEHPIVPWGRLHFARMAVTESPPHTLFRNVTFAIPYQRWKQLFVPLNLGCLRDVFLTEAAEEVSLHNL